MAVVVVALVALLAVQHYLAVKERGRLLDALMARNAGEYAMIRRSTAPAGKPAKQLEPEAEPTRFVVGFD